MACNLWLAELYDLKRETSILTNVSMQIHSFPSPPQRTFPLADHKWLVCQLLWVHCHFLDQTCSQIPYHDLPQGQFYLSCWILIHRSLVRSIAWNILLISPVDNFRFHRSIQVHLLGNLESWILGPCIFHPRDWLECHTSRFAPRGERSRKLCGYHWLNRSEKGQNN